MEDGNNVARIKGSSRRDASPYPQTDLPDFTQLPSTKDTRPSFRTQIDPDVYSEEGSKWDKIAGSMRELMENKTRKGENPKSAKMQKNCDFGYARFGGFTHMLAVGRCGGDLVASAKRRIDSGGIL